MAPKPARYAQPLLAAASLACGRCNPLPLGLFIETLATIHASFSWTHPDPPCRCYKSMASDSMDGSTEFDGNSESTCRSAQRNSWGCRGQFRLQLCATARHMLCAHRKPLDPRRIAKDLYTAMLRDNEEDVEEILSYPLEQVSWSWRDMSGATLLHHAARLGWPSVVRRVLDREPGAVAIPTHIGARPSLWLPLHVATERAVQTDEERAVASTIVGLLAAVMDDVDFAALTSSRSNALHFVAGKGAHWLVDALVEGRQVSVLSSMMEQRNERARHEQVF